jgi:hypothetical protein
MNQHTEYQKPNLGGQGNGELPGSSERVAVPGQHGQRGV